MTIWLRGITLSAAIFLSTPALSGETQTYTYDALGRLIAITSSGTINNGQKRSICYDPAGNRTEYKSDSTGSGLACAAVAPPNLSIGNASVTEGGVLVFTVTRTGDMSTAVGVSYSTASGTAISGSDFTPTSGTLSFAAGQSSATISVPTIDDTVVESSETLGVTLSAPTGGATLGTASATGTISDNDGASATYLVISDASGLEGFNLSFTVTRSGNISGTTSVTYATAPGTAAANDYVAASGTLTFAPGQTALTITVAAKTDARAENDEIFYVNLSSPTGGAILNDAQGAGTIFDDGNGGIGGGCPTC